MPISLSCHHLGSSEIIFATYSADMLSSNELRGFVVNDVALIGFAHINSEDNCRELLEFTQQLYKQILKKEIRRPLRVVSIQFSSVENEWNLVQDQHRNLLKFTADHAAEFQATHLCFLLEFAKSQKKEVSTDFNKKLISQLLKQFNAEALLTYCSWFNEGCEQAIRNFPFEASEEYQLQALLEDFSHEVRSPLLYDQQQSIIKNMLEEEIAIKVGDQDQLLSLEMLVISTRVQLLSDLQTQSDLLTHIVDGIQKIEEMHPELATLRRQAILLNQVILNHFVRNEYAWSWEKQVLMMQLLDEQLEVLPIVCYEAGDEPAASVFSLRLALAELKKTYSFDVLLETCLEWDQKLEKESKIRHDLRQLVIRNLDVL